MSINVNQNHINKGSILLTAGFTGLDGLSRTYSALSSNSKGNTPSQKAFQTVLGVTEIAAAFFAGKAALK